jgi:chitin deacetylase
MVLFTPDFVKEEIEKTDELIRKVGYTKEITFQPPFGKKLFALPFYLSNNNRKTITWDVEPETFAA